MKKANDGMIQVSARDWTNLQRRLDELAKEVERLRRENEDLRNQVDDDE